MINGKEAKEEESKRYFEQHPEVLHNEFGLDKDIIRLFENQDEKTLTQENINTDNKEKLLQTLHKNSPPKQVKKQAPKKSK